MQTLLALADCSESVEGNNEKGEQERLPKVTLCLPNCGLRALLSLVVCFGHAILLSPVRLPIDGYLTFALLCLHTQTVKRSHSPTLSTVALLHSTLSFSQLRPMKQSVNSLLWLEKILF